MIAPSLSVILVEDNPADARQLRQTVEESGEGVVDLHPCHRLAEAIERMEERPADCILLDLSLPDASGLAGVESLRARFPALPIVILTGLADEGIALEALKAGVQDYLVKGQSDGDAIKRAVRYAVERKHAELEVARLARQNELILDSAGDGICGVTPDGVVTFANPAAAAMLGRAREDFLGTHICDLVHGCLQDSVAHLPDECPVVASPEEGRPREDAFWHSDGSSFQVEYLATSIGEGGLVLTFKDITERKRAESQLQHLADHDGLTGLFNRRRFGEEVTRQIGLTDSLGVASALLVLEIDNFNFLNEALGHAAGEDLLRSIATQLTERVRRTDVVARLEGAEFGVLLTGADEKHARDLANELVLMAGGHRFLAGGKPTRVSASVGIAMLNRAELTAERVLMEADVAMYEAKSSGRGGAVMFARDAKGGPDKRPGFVWTDRIKRALDDDLFVVYAQPIKGLARKYDDRYELLLRMREDDGTVVPPTAFLSVAERFGLISAIDAWMIRRAVKLTERELELGRRIVLEVNLSGHSISDPEIPEVIEDALTRSPISPSQLVFEITETAAIANMEEARELAGRIRRWGCRFALDDFGAGFGSFYYLKYLPVDYLKIDGEFIRNLDSSEIDQRMVAAMVEIARALGLRTIAEFVESDAILARLREFDVDFVQGYHVGRPAPVEEMLRLKGDGTFTPDRHISRASNGAGRPDGPSA